MRAFQNNILTLSFVQKVYISYKFQKLIGVQSQVIYADNQISNKSTYFGRQHKWCTSVDIEQIVVNISFNLRLSYIEFMVFYKIFDDDLKCIMNSRDMKKKSSLW